MRIKFCGITSIADARAAVELGVDALGFVFYRDSPRYVAPTRAKQIIAEVGPFVTTVGLFVNAPPDEVEAIINTTGLDIVQFHGDETPEQCAGVSRPWIKALRIRPDTDLLAADEQYAAARGLLLDTFSPRVYGGSGEVFDWSLVPTDRLRPFILAGGLSSDNVAAAIRSTTPWAVDVSGGIETQKGVKNRVKMEQFISEVRNLEC